MKIKNPAVEYREEEEGFAAFLLLLLFRHIGVVLTNRKSPYDPFSRVFFLVEIGRSPYFFAWKYVNGFETANKEKRPDLMPTDPVKRGVKCKK